jgi:xanthine dehydrogenase accessory factor
MKLPTILIRGAGELASGVAHRLYKCGFHIIMLEIDKPMVVRRTVSFAQAVFDGETTVEGVTARLISNIEYRISNNKFIPIIIDPDGKSIDDIHPDVIIDARIAKRNIDTKITSAPLVIGLGPGLIAKVDVHKVIETNRGHNLGRIIEEGTAEENTGIPGNIGGYTEERLLRATANGEWKSKKKIGDKVCRGDVIGEIVSPDLLKIEKNVREDEQTSTSVTPVRIVVAKIDGVIRGLLHDNLIIKEGTKIGDIDPRGNPAYAYTISDKSRAVAGGVLEAILSKFLIKIE